MYTCKLWHQLKVTAAQHTQTCYTWPMYAHWICRHWQTTCIHTNENMCWLWLTTNHPKEWSYPWTVQIFVPVSAVFGGHWSAYDGIEIYCTYVERLTTCSAQRRAWRLDACHQCAHWTLYVWKERKGRKIIGYIQTSSTAHILNTLATAMH